MAFKVNQNGAEGNESAPEGGPKNKNKKIQKRSILGDPESLGFLGPEPFFSRFMVIAKIDTKADNKSMPK